ncbi:muscle-specific protein 20-like [Sarcoptes scabiei]|nr:muscle-specific protein 20-like [Sarcoptes scabiei]
MYQSSNISPLTSSTPSASSSSASSPMSPIMALPMTTTITSSSSSSSIRSISSKMPSKFAINAQASNSIAYTISQFINAAIQNDVRIINSYHQMLNIPVDVVDVNGYTPLIYASRNGNVNVVRRLIELNANVDYQEPMTLSTALHYAAQCGHTRTAEALIIIGKANKEILNQAGKTPFELAKDFGHGNNKIMRSLFCDHLDRLSSSSLVSSSTKDVMSSSSSLDSCGYTHIDPNQTLISNSESIGELDQNNNDMATKSTSQSNLLMENLFTKSINQHQKNNNHYASNNNNDLYHSKDHHSNNGGIGGGGNHQQLNCRMSSMSRKNLTYLPNQFLLERFAQHGCYRSVGDGFGFELLAKNGPTQQMIYEAFINLSIPMNDIDSLLFQLKKIINDFENNNQFTLKEYQSFDPQHPDYQRINNLFAFNAWRKDNVDKIVKMINHLQQWKAYILQYSTNYTDTKY